MLDKIKRNFEAGNACIRRFNAELAAFHAACLRADWSEAEKIHERAAILIDAYFCHTVAAYEGVEAVESGTRSG